MFVLIWISSMKVSVVQDFGKILRFSICFLAIVLAPGFRI